MAKSHVLTAVVLGQAFVLLTGGAATFWWSGDLMRWLIHLVGEEQALGPSNVIRREDGSTLLTNPGRIILWVAPFWFLGCLQITSALTLVGLWVGRLTMRSSDQAGARESDRRTVLQRKQPL